MHLLPAHRFRPALLLQHGHADAVTAVVVTADGERLITAGLDSTIRVWRGPRDRVLLRTLSGPMIGVTALALAPDGQFLASGDGMGQVRVWDLGENRERFQEGASPHPVPSRPSPFSPRDRGRFVTLDAVARAGSGM